MEVRKRLRNGTSEVGCPSHKRKRNYTGIEKRKRQVQQKITFPVRRSSRKIETLIQNEIQEEIKKKIRDKVEEGLRVVEVEGKGRGVFPTRPFRKGEFIVEYSGELISMDEAKKREKDYLNDEEIGSYMYYFSNKSSKLCIDATKDNGRLGRLVNHSKKSPNVVTKVLEVDGHPYLCLMAARDVEVGEELQYDYGERRNDIVKSFPWLAS